MNAQLIDGNGKALASRANVGAGGYKGSRVDADASNRFIVVWAAYDDNGAYDVLALQYDDASMPLGSAFAVSKHGGSSGHGLTNAGRYGADVCMSDYGDFTVVWAEGGSSVTGSSDGSSTGVFARNFTRNAVASGNEILVNTFTTSGQSAQSRDARHAFSDGASTVSCLQ